jgi:hypothetical protein
VEGAICGMRGMCWISYTVTHQPELSTFLLQQDELLRVQYGSLRTYVVVQYRTFSGLRSPHHTNRKVLKKVYSEVAIEKLYKGQNFIYLFLSLQTRKSTGMLCEKELFS